jgi:meiotically up-regulated gene 157 (Mug157) protein
MVRRVNRKHIAFTFTPHVREGKFELDSLMNFLRLSHSYFTAVVNSSAAVTLSPFDSTWLLAVNKTLEVVVNMSRSFDEQYMQPSYKFQRETHVPSDTLLQFGLGPPSRACGLVRSPFRASDDATNLPMNIPENALAVVSLRGIADMCAHGSKLVVACDDIGDVASSLASAIDAAIFAHGVSTNSRFPGVLAFEVDCFGNQVIFARRALPCSLLHHELSHV